MRLNAHVLFLFVNSLDECASIRAKNRVLVKEFKCSSGFEFRANAAWRAKAPTKYWLRARLARKKKDGLGGRECGRQQHERRGAGSEAAIGAAGL
jgi:hypothetical protein